MSKTKNTKPRTLFLKGWHARRRKAEKRNANAKNSHRPKMVHSPVLASIAKEVAATQPMTLLRQQMPLVSKASVSQPDLDLFGRPIHRQRDAVRHAGRKVSRVRPRSSWKKFLWPLIGAGLDLIDGRTFDWASHSEAFDDGITVSVYVATCDSICELGSHAKVPVAKIGISERVNLTERMDELNGIGYGNIVRDKMGVCQIESGFDDWHALRLPPSARPDHDSPVESNRTRLLVSLPGTLDVEAFDALLKAALAPSAIAAWSSTEDGILHCARMDVDPRALQRYSAYPQDDGDHRISISEELYCFRPALDPAILVKIIESIIAQHLVEEAKATIGARSNARAATIISSGLSSKQADLFPEAPKAAWPLFWSLTLKVSSS